MAKGGPKLNPPADTIRSGIGTGRTGPVTAAALTTVVTGRNATMQQLARYLEQGLGRPVTDDTGIAGNFDFRFEYGPDNAPVENVAPFFTALQDSTGLKLTATKGPVEFLVIDHAEKLTTN